MARFHASKLLIPLILLLGLALPVEAPACPSCKEAVAQQGGEAARAANGYNYSILLMMAMPLTLFGAGAYFVVRAARRGDLPQF